jgi:hypothetical protein
MGLTRRIYHKYKEGGVKALAAVTTGRFRHWISPYTSVVFWARLGAVSSFLGDRLRTQNPPVLVLSLPRSGSSWVGETLGNAANALYLREPITQSYLEEVGRRNRVVFEIDPSNLLEVYKRAADTAFSGIPAFPPHIVKYPKQWNLFSRRHRRLVIKEVNPMASEWLLQHYLPRVVFLVRHPAAVALSYRQLGWWQTPDPIGKEHGKYQGAAIRVALDNLVAYQDYRVVLYEELCANPIDVFRSLFEFAGLVWDRNMEAYVQERTTGGCRADSMETSRDSRSMIRSWVGQLSKKELESLRTGFSEFNLPWYKSTEGWQ